MSNRVFGRVVRLLATAVAVILAVPVRAADAPDKSSPRPRVLILGDSISIGYTPLVKRDLQDVAEVFRPKENCQHTAYGLEHLDRWLGTEKWGTEKWDVIHFNWGIWDTHMLSAQNELIRDEAGFKGESHIRHTPEQYRENLTKLVDKLEKTGATLIWATTTPCLSRTGNRFADIKNLNKVADEIMRKRGIAVDDLYEFALPNAAAWQQSDKAHFNETGNERLGKQVSDSIRAALRQKQNSAASAKREGQQQGNER